MTELKNRTHTLVGLANPFSYCKQCDERVTYRHLTERCNCSDGPFNYPCTHFVDTYSQCPTWDPIFGCTCKTQHGS